MNKQGFSLLELLVGLVLSSIIGTVLFNTFFQSTRTLRMVDEYAELDTGIAVILSQVERDLAGTLAPTYEQEPKKEEAGEKKTPGPKKEVEKKEETTEKKPSFVSKTKNKQLDYVTFLTTNPRSRYVPLPTSMPKPSLVRVMYKLRDNKEHKGAFVLLRQESTNLDLASFAKKNEKRPRELVVSDNVQECFIEFVYREEKEDGKLQTVQEWGAKTEEEIPPLPMMVKLNLTLWDARFQVKRSIEYLIPMYSTYVELPKKKESKKSLVETMTGAVMPTNPSVGFMFKLPTNPQSSAAPNTKHKTLAELLGRQ